MVCIPTVSLLTFVVTRLRRVFYMRTGEKYPRERRLSTHQYRLSCRTVFYLPQGNYSLSYPNKRGFRITPVPTQGFDLFLRLAYSFLFVPSYRLIVSVDGTNLTIENPWLYHSPQKEMMGFNFDRIRVLFSCFPASDWVTFLGSVSSWRLLNASVIQAGGFINLDKTRQTSF